MARKTAEGSFDELARGLASGEVMRGKALRLMGVKTPLTGQEFSEEPSRAQKPLLMFKRNM